LFKNDFFWSMFKNDFFFWSNVQKWLSYCMFVQTWPFYFIFLLFIFAIDWITINTWKDFWVQNRIRKMLLHISQTRLQKWDFSNPISNIYIFFSFTIQFEVYFLWPIIFINDVELNLMMPCCQFESETMDFKRKVLHLIN
jgi:hypothetical protein